MLRTLSREAVKVPQSLHNNLALYALAAGATGVGVLALAQPAEGEVVYTPAHEIIGRRQSFAIDLNHDGVADFTVANLFFEDFGPSGIYAQAILQAVPDNGGAIVRSNEGYAAAALEKGASIGPQEPLGHGHQVMAFRTAQGSFGTYSFGPWFNVSNQYLGFQFTINGQVHYGWARLTVTWNHEFRIGAGLTGYAYETQPDTPITAGDTGGANATSWSPTSEKAESPSLGALALGSGGLAIWRRP